MAEILDLTLSQVGGVNTHHLNKMLQGAVYTMTYDTSPVAFAATIPHTREEAELILEAAKHTSLNIPGIRYDIRMKIFNFCDIVTITSRRRRKNHVPEAFIAALPTDENKEYIIETLMKIRERINDAVSKM